MTMNGHPWMPSVSISGYQRPISAAHGQGWTPTAIHGLGRLDMVEWVPSLSRCGCTGRGKAELHPQRGGGCCILSRLRFFAAVTAIDCHMHCHRYHHHCHPGGLIWPDRMIQTAPVGQSGTRLARLPWGTQSLVSRHTSTQADMVQAIMQ